MFQEIESQMEELPPFIKKIQLIDEPRLAVFDADGTLWAGDVADDCTLWLMSKGVIPIEHDRWEEYRQLFDEDPDRGCAYLLTFYRGLSLHTLRQHVLSYWADYMGLPFISSTITVLNHLTRLGFKIWVVSGTPAELLMPLSQILAVDRILGNDFQVNNQGVINGCLAGISCVGPGKVAKVRAMWDGPVQFAAGNAMMDEELLRLARDVAWAVHPHPQLAELARRMGWEVTMGDSAPYGTAGWLTLAQELARFSLASGDTEMAEGEEKKGRNGEGAD